MKKLVNNTINIIDMIGVSTMYRLNSDPDISLYITLTERMFTYKKSTSITIKNSILI